jgi:nucleoside-diphosphate-sugar epimerase
MAFFLVTGGAGFIGSHIVRELLRRRQRVRVLDNFSTGRAENLRSSSGRIHLIRGDVRDTKVVQRAVRNIDYVLHQAALASVPRSIDDPGETNEVNVQGTLNMLVASRDARVRRFVFASSSSVYGTSRRLPKVERMRPTPLSPYAITKLTGEKYCQIFFDLYGLKTVCLRYFNVFGPQQDPGSQYAAVIPKFILAMLNGCPPVIYGDGEQSRDFAFVSNVVQANILACRTGHIAGEVMNIACGSRSTINTLVAHLQRLLRADIVPRHVDPRPGDVRHSLADISKARSLLGYEPNVSFRAGLKETVAWFKKRYGTRPQAAS